MKVLASCLFLVMSGLAGCAEQTDVDEKGEVQTTSAPLRLTDPKGKKWLRGAKAAVATADEEAEYARRFREIMYERALNEQRMQAEGKAVDPAPLTLDDFAHKLRAKHVVGEYEYETEPDYDSAAKILSGAMKNFGSPPSEAADPKRPTPEEMRGMVDGVFGSDGREIRRDNTSYPARVQILLTDANGGGSTCSATMVGPSTAVSAAHCFHTGSAWLSTRAWAPGVDSRDTNRFTFDPTPTTDLTYPHSTANRITGCYRVTIPGGWDGSSDSDDFAVIEFDKDWWLAPCSENWTAMNDHPGNTVGWFGIWNETEAEIETTSTPLYAYGYPGGSACPGGSCFWPSVWGVGVSSGTNATGAAIRNYIDVTPGQSGSGVYHYATHGSYGRVVVGVVTHYYWSESCFLWSCDTTEYNVARRVDSTFAAFLVNHTSL